MEKPRRHSWIKLRIHVYLCRHCAIRRLNAQQLDGQWFMAFHRPDGSCFVSSRVPPCEPGPKTAAWLKHYAEQINEASGWEIAELPAAQ